MPARRYKTLVACVILSLCVILSAGCQDLKYHSIYMSAAAGAAVGAIVGYQSDECGAGAGIGAGAFAVGELLRQIDDLPKEKKLEEAAEEVARGDSLLNLTRSE